MVQITAGRQGRAEIQSLPHKRARTRYRSCTPLHAQAARPLTCECPIARPPFCTSTVDTASDLRKQLHTHPHPFGVVLGARHRAQHRTPKARGIANPVPIPMPIPEREKGQKTVIRTCSGQDRHLVTENGQPCACGLTFDDADRTVIFPHQELPPKRSLEELEAAYPELLELYRRAGIPGYAEDHD